MFSTSGLRHRSPKESEHARSSRDGALRRGWLLAVGVGFVLVGLASLPPFVGAEAREMLMAAFAPVCHQMPARSPHWHGVALAVCHRCYGIYWGLPLAALGFLALRRWDHVLGRRAGLVLLLALVPMGIDWGGDVAGLWTNTPVTRLLTGGVFGLAAGYYLARALVDLMVQRQAAALRARPEEAPPEKA